MISATLVGTSGMTPLPDRHLSSCIIKCNGSNYLIDAGEGTQIGLRKIGCSLKKINYVLLTHYHTDHIGGLSGLFASMANSEKDDLLTIIGPKGLNRTIDATRKLVSKLPFAIKTIELADEYPTMNLDGLEVTPFPVEHKIPCLGYQFILQRNGKCDPDKAKRNDVPMELWTDLQNNKVVNYNGRIITKDAILSNSRKGLKIVYTTDTRPCNSIKEAAKNADLFICEGMYGSDMKVPNAAKSIHMTMEDAATIAAGCGVKELILTHFSPAMVQPNKYESDLKDIFSRTTVGYDGLTRELEFSDN